MSILIGLAVTSCIGTAPDDHCQFEYCNFNDENKLPQISNSIRKDLNSVVLNYDVFTIDSIKSIVDSSRIVSDNQFRKIVNAVLQRMEHAFDLQIAKDYRESGVPSDTIEVLKDEHEVYYLGKLSQDVDYGSYLFLIDFGDGSEIYIARKLYVINVSQSGIIKSASKISDVLSNTGDTRTTGYTTRSEDVYVYHSSFFNANDVIHTDNASRATSSRDVSITKFKMLPSGFIEIVWCGDESKFK